MPMVVVLIMRVCVVSKGVVEEGSWPSKKAGRREGALEGSRVDPINTVTNLHLC